MKFFLEQDARAISLAKDTTYMGQDIRTQDSIIAEQKLNENDLRDIINTQQVITNLWEQDSKMYQDSMSYYKNKYLIADKKASKRLKVIIRLTLAHITKDLAIASYFYLKP